ncbi:MAG: transcriptional regulator [Leptospirillia bacterium]
MFRKDLEKYLMLGPVSVRDLARQLQVKVRDLADDLAHLEKSLRRTDRHLLVHPARCRKCGFVFSPDKLTRPGRCPACRGSWITDPRVEVQATPE